MTERRIVMIGYSQDESGPYITNIYELKAGAEDPRFNFRWWFGQVRHDNEHVIVTSTDKIHLTLREHLNA